MSDNGRMRREADLARQRAERWPQKYGRANDRSGQGSSRPAAVDHSRPTRENDR